MAKLKAPLQSFGASGQVAKSLVFFPWKGLNCVREFVIPANPRTAAQTTQRARLTAAVAEFHGALYTAADMVGLNRWAGIIKGAMTGFNAMVREHIKESILGNTWQRIDDVTVANVGDTDFDVDCHLLAPGADPTCHYGTSKTFMPNTIVLDNVGAAHWAKTIPGLTAETLYYFYISHGVSGTDWGRTGIYAQRTIAA